MAVTNLGTIGLSFYALEGAVPGFTTFPIPLTNDDGTAPTATVDNDTFCTVEVGGSDPNWVGTITAGTAAGLATITFGADSAPDQTLGVVVTQAAVPEFTAVNLADVQAGIVAPALPAPQTPSQGAQADAKAGTGPGASTGAPPTGGNLGTPDPNPAPAPVTAETAGSATTPPTPAS